MKDHWEATRIENPVGPGTPDVFYALKDNGRMGWIELKHVHEWPKRPTTPLKIPHFTADQRTWIKRYGSIGAQVHVFLQVDREYFLLEWEPALLIDTLLYNDYIDLAFYWRNRINYSELFSILR